MFAVALFLVLSLSNQVRAEASTKVPDILDASAIDPTVSPCDDFYQFSCGQWLKDNPVPSDKTAVSHSITALSDEIDENLNQLLIRLSQGDTSLKASATRQLSDYYSTCMNFTKASSQSRDVLKSQISRIHSVRRSSDLARLVADFELQGINAFFGFGSGQDMNDSRSVIGFLGQAGMNLPEPNYYFDMDPKSVSIRREYEKHIAKMLWLFGMAPRTARQHAHEILKIETDLASQAYSLERRGEPTQTNHVMTMDELKMLVPGFNWDVYFSELGLMPSKVNVSEPEFFVHLNQILTSNLSHLKVYLTWQALLRSGPFINVQYDKEVFHFWQRILHGQKTMKPRWKRCTQATEGRLGYGLGEVYIDTIDTVTIRTRITAMIDLIKQAFRDDLKDLSIGNDAWMDPSTMQAALQKLDLLSQKVGAPNQWRDYSSLKTDARSYLLNDIKIVEFESRRDLAKIGKPVDRTEWDMMPWEINAYYNPSMNEFVFPFGILQPPTFDVRASDGANLGAFGGGTIGHELTHGYDNSGRQFDGYGNLKDWWSPQTRKVFTERSQCFIDQADKYTIKEVGLNVNGKNTLPENLADQGGVKLGYSALIAAQANRPEAPLWLGKYTENQQYWIAYAQSWCTKHTPESLRVVITTNEHPPEEFRVNGVLINRPEFARDFGCKANDRMAPSQRCSLW